MAARNHASPTAAMTAEAWRSSISATPIQSVAVPSENANAKNPIVWLRLPHGGKARALNAAIVETGADVVVTVDGDTLLEPEAIGAVRQAFCRESELVGVTGIITPVCKPTRAGQAWQFFQTYEYIRNFLGRYAWMRVDCLQLISGAFAGFRRAPVIEVGGFDDVCLVEDYELVHRLRRYAGEHGLTWRFRVIGGAQARTEAPGSTAAFLRQRRRWFGGPRRRETRAWPHRSPSWCRPSPARGSSRSRRTSCAVGTGAST